MHMLAKVALVLTALLTIGGASCNRNDPARIARQKGIEAFKKEKWSEAAEEWAKSIAANPEQEDKLYESQAIAATRAGHPDEAAQTLLKLMERKTDLKEKVEIKKKVANTYMQANRPDKAEQYYLDILKDLPKDEYILSWLAELHSQLGGARAAAAPADLGQLDKALSYYDKVIAINPNAQTPYLNKRIALYKLVEYWTQKKTKAEDDELKIEVPELSKKLKGKKLAAAKEAKEKAEAKKAAAHKKVTDYQAKLDALKPKVEEATQKLTEALKKAKVAPAPTAQAQK